MPGDVYPLDISVRAVTDAVTRWGNAANTLESVRRIAQRPCCGRCEGSCDATALEGIRAILGVGL